MDKEGSEDIKEFLVHPLNAFDFSPEDPLYQGLQALALESDPNLAARSALVNSRPTHS